MTTTSDLSRGDLVRISNGRTLRVEQIHTLTGMIAGWDQNGNFIAASAANVTEIL